MSPPARRKRPAKKAGKPPPLPVGQPVPALSGRQWAAWRALTLTHSLIVPILSKRLQNLCGIIWVEYMILSALGRAREQRELDGVPDKGMRLKELAIMAGVTNPALRTAVERLRGDGGNDRPGTEFVTEHRNPMDERSFLIRLTPAGVELLKTADLEVAWFARKWFVDAGSDADLEALHRVLGACCARFDVAVDTRLPAPRPGPPAPSVPVRIGGILPVDLPTERGL